MKVFSNRHDRYALRDITVRQRASASSRSTFENRSSSSLLNAKLRTRLTHLLKFITSNEDYLESFILVKDFNGKTELYSKNIRDFSEAELGYNIAENLNTDSVEILVNDDDESIYDDITLFDLIEVLIVLTKEDKRDDFVSRLNSIFKDESAVFMVNGWMIIPINQPGIGSLLPLIKNPTLKEKLHAVRTIGAPSSPQARARNAADAVQYIFSSETKGGTKTAAESLLMDIAKRWTSPEKVDDLYDLLNQQVTLTKNFNNQIGNIRHTDKHTIEIEGPGMFDMIYKLNMSITELALVTEQGKYIEDKSASEIKNEYSQNYKVDLGLQYKKKVRSDEPIDLSEIPF